MPANKMEPVPLLIPSSYLTTESNKTGTWRFLKPFYSDKTAPCSGACPAGEDIGRIQMLTSQGLFTEAWETVLYENPFPAVCGRVCYHPCEKPCNRASFDQAVAIHTVERFLADTAARNALKPHLEKLLDRKQRVAVVGAGPAGLAAAYFLARLGYGCDVYEERSEPGGLLRWGIPSYRLTIPALKEEIARIQELGVRITCGKPIGRDILEQADGSYDAVFLACGHHRGSKLRVPGEDLSGVEDGLQFLERIAAGEMPVLKESIAVIGGGNTAIDVARSAVRLGVKVLLIYRRRRDDMPAFEEEVGMALEEGVQLLELLAPVRIDAEGDGYVLTLQRMEVAGQDDRGKALIEPVRDQLETIRVSRIFKATGLEAAEHWMVPPATHSSVLQLSNSVLIKSNRGLPIVFGGDLSTELKSVAHAVASGKEAAMTLDVLFREGLEAIEPKLRSCAVGNGRSLSMEVYMGGPRSRRSSHIVTYDEINADYFRYTARVAQPRLLKAERVKTFGEIDLKISAGLAMQEAERCFNCGLCNQCDNCRLFCPDLAVIRGEQAAGERFINYDYCKGCGICVVECPRNAMSLEEENARERREVP